MKKFFLFLLIILFKQNIIFAQDTIVLLDKSILEVKVLEITRKEIIYKKTNSSLHEIDRKWVWYVVRENGQRDSINFFKKVKKVHFGVVPYQLLSRSSGIYFEYTVNKRFSIEYRPTYTYATRILSSVIMLGTRYDWFFYQGVNNNILFSIQFSSSWKTALMLGYKYWWFENEWIPAEGGKSGGNNFLNVKRSNIISGPVIGWEFQKDISSNNFDAAFFINTSFTFFSGTTTIYETEIGGSSFDNNLYPKTYYIFNLGFHVGIGVKLGYRK